VGACSGAREKAMRTVWVRKGEVRRDWGTLL
jgi:hypothetical protein